MMAEVTTDLTARIDALRRVVESGAGLFDRTHLDSARNIVRQADARLRHGLDVTVVALVGATGSGKSSIFNALVGDEVSPVGLLRPTTDQPRAAVFGERLPDPLLDWLGIRRRHAVAAGDLDGLVLLDVPDHDSVVTGHRLDVDRLVELVDVMVWVLDPQKYADEAVHRRYLARLSGHDASMVFLLNQADRVPEHEHARWKAHAADLLAGDGIDAPTILLTSATGGAGIDEVRELLASKIGSRTAALERLDADMRAVVAQLGAVPAPASTEPEALNALVRSLGDAAGSNVLADAVAAGYRHDAARHTGWPFARWLLRFRRHPLRRLTPASPPSGPDTPGRPTAIPVDRPRLDLAVRTYADARTGRISPQWLRRARRAAAARADELPVALGAAIRSVAHEGIAPARWWGWVGALQGVLAGVAAAGAIWLLALAILGYLRVPTDELTPQIGSWPVPTAMLFAGGLTGVVVGWLARIAASIGAGRRSRQAKRQIGQAIALIAAEKVGAVLDAEFDRWRSMSADLAVAAGRDP